MPNPQADDARVQNPDWLGVVGVCGHLGCVVRGQRPTDQKGEYSGWFCPCHGSHFDTSGQQTGMILSLFDDLVEYEDGTEASVDQMAKDVTAFLSWAAGPHMEQRKKLGIKIVVFLLLLTTMLYALKREVWAHLHGNRPSEPAPHDPVTEDRAPTRPSP